MAQIEAGESDLSQRLCDIKMQNLQLLFTRPAFQPQEPKFASKDVRMKEPSKYAEQCQHMKRVKSLRNGWVYGWQGTRDGTLYKLPGDQETGWYYLIGTAPTTKYCPCLRLIPVDSIQSSDNSNVKSSHRQGTTHSSMPTMLGSCGEILPAFDKNLPPLLTHYIPGFQSPQVQPCGEGCRCHDVQCLQVTVPQKVQPHPKVYCQMDSSKPTAPDPDRTKAGNAR